jgi:hypothetical protein
LALVLLVAGAALAACITVQPITGHDGSREYLIACGASTGWNICYGKAEELCPTGYETLAEQGGFNRKELRISCPAAQTPQKVRR